MDKKKLILNKLLPFTVIFGFLIYTVYTNYFAEANGGTTPPQAEAIEQDNVNHVIDLTNQLIDNFSVGETRSLDQITGITKTYLPEAFYTDVYTVPHEQERWLGMFGLGTFYDGQSKAEGLNIEFDHSKGRVKSFTVEADKDNHNQTITTYIRMDAQKDNIKHWIEWRDIPGEGWKINAVSFSANIEYLETPISPKREWQ